MIVGRLIPAGTGFAHHEDRRRTQEEILSEELKELEAQQQKAAQESGRRGRAGRHHSAGRGRLRPGDALELIEASAKSRRRAFSARRRHIDVPAWIASPRPR